jgi:hypothetical protein
MDNPIVQLPIDLTGSNPNNLVGAEEHLLVDYDGFPYKIITLLHGGFYTRGLKVFNSNYDKLEPYKDYIVTYNYQQLSQRTGLKVCQDIVFINKTITGLVYVTAQMVGGDLAYSFSAITDYVAWFNTQPPGYIPKWEDYNGFEPTWLPGELAQKRWGLDTYQPANNELENIARKMMIGHDGSQEELRKKIRDRYNVFISRFTDRLNRHIQDLANPHETTAELVELGLVNNLPVATVPEAIGISTNAAYLTPWLAWQVADEKASKPLKAHVDINPGNPHDLKPAQVNVHPFAEADAIIQSKQPKGSTVTSANTIFYKGAWMTFNEYVRILRQNLDVSMFPIGMLSAAQIASGSTNEDSILRGDRRFTRIDDIMSEFVPPGGAKIITFTSPSNNVIVVKQWLDTTFPYWPLGSVAITEISWTVGQGWGNGGAWFDTNFTHVYVMSPSGWVLT